MNNKRQQKKRERALIALPIITHVKDLQDIEPQEQFAATNCNINWTRIDSGTPKSQLVLEKKG